MHWRCSHLPALPAECRSGCRRHTSSPVFPHICPLYTRSVLRAKSGAAHRTQKKAPHLDCHEDPRSASPCLLPEDPGRHPQTAGASQG